MEGQLNNLHYRMFTYSTEKDFWAATMEPKQQSLAHEISKRNISLGK